MFVGYRYGAKMSATETTEFPDLDTLINAADNRSGESSGEGNYSDKGAFDPDEYAGFVQWYSEQSKNLQRHYETHLEHQKQKLAEENEAGLLEALQQSLKNFESDHMSDFASISSLESAHTYLAPNSTSGVDSCSDGVEKQSMLKELLLSPFSENYSREIDSPDHAPSDLNKFGSSSPEGLSPGSGASEKSRPAKKLKPFAELLKHMEASESTMKKAKTSASSRSRPNGTRLVNTKRYMSKYASANSNRKDAPLKVDSKNLGKRIVLHPVKNGSQNCKTLTLSLKPKTIAKFANSNPTSAIGTSSVVTTGASSSKNSPIFSTSVTTVKTVTITSQKLAEKRAATPPSDQIPHKKPCKLTSSVTGQSIDHDYCTIQSKKSEEKADANKNSTYVENFTAPNCLKSPAKPAAQRVLKWQDYLQQVRAGVRSAPNSPTTSPKIVRGSARPSNNFMVVSLQANQVTPKIFVNTMAGKGKINTKVPIPEALRKTAIKQTFGLQEFDKYMKVLKNNMSSSSGKMKEDTSARPVAVANDSPTKPADLTSCHNFSAAHSLAAMAQQQQSEILKENAKQKSPQLLKYQSPPQSASKKQQKLIPIATSTSGQLLMVQVPVSSSSVPRTASSKTKSPTVTNAISTSDNTEKVGSNSDVRTFVTSPVSSPAQVAPTFKLMTSNKDGAESKSLILSGVTGKLKDILTLMAEQQAKCKSENIQLETMSSEQQLNTLQKLISCLSSQQHLKLDRPQSPDSGKSKSCSNVVPGKTDSVCSAVSVDSGAKTEAVVQAGPSSLVLAKCGVATDIAQAKSNSIQMSASENCKTAAFVEVMASPNDTKETDVEEGTRINVSRTELFLSESVPALSANSVQLQPAVESEESLIHSAAAAPVAAANSASNLKSGDAAGYCCQKFSMARSMAAAEMLASDVIDDGTQEILVYSKPEQKPESIDGNNNRVELINDNDPAVINLEEAMEQLEDDDILNEDKQQTTSLAAADHLFNKLPSYFLTGKLVSEGGKQEENIEGLKKRGMKNVHCDPLISSKGSDVEFSKLPHYMSSGKFSRQSSPSRNGGKLCTVDKSAVSSKDYAVKLNKVGDSQHLTPQGAPVDTSETYFSKLPSYYTYGRPHPPLKTFNDDVTYAKDDTVTSETLVTHKHEKHHRGSKRKHKAKKKRKKHKRASKRDDTSERVMYSKLPSYYLSGRVLGSHERDRSSRISPLPSYSVRSPTRRSLSYSSRSSLSRSRSRSPLRRSRSRKRHSSRSFSRSSSRSFSGSEGESRRSWRRERKSSRRRGRSYDRRSYDSSDEDRDEFIWRREREARRARKQHQDAFEKERLRAMEERRVVYVGGIDKKMTKQELRRKFLRFGNIEAVSLHFRDDGDDYGFLTFQYTSDAFRAIEEGVNLGPGEPQYNLCFGGRRQFCKAAYQDLDSKVAEDDSKSNNALDDFDALLQQAKRSLRR